MVNNQKNISPIIGLTLLVILWALLSRGELTAWIIGAPFLALAWIVWLRLKDNSSLENQCHIRPLGLALFLVYFITESVKGAWDVSRKVLTPRLSLASTFYDYPIRLKGLAAQRFFIGSISLLPGTLSADIKDDAIYIHILDDKEAALKGIERLEQRVAALFGEDYGS